MDIEPASLTQIARGRDGKVVAIDDDVSGIAQQLKEIDPSLRLRYSEAGEYFAVYCETPQETYLVTTAQELDGRILQRIRKVASGRYDYVAELDALDARAERERERAFSERMGEAHEKLRHGLRKDLGIKNRIILPGD
jgi:hypothetical protein